MVWMQYVTPPKWTDLWAMSTVVKTVEHTFRPGSSRASTEPFDPWSACDCQSKRWNNSVYDLAHGYNFFFPASFSIDFIFLPTDHELTVGGVEKTSKGRWSHSLEMLDDPDGSCADVVLYAKDNSSIRAHRWFLNRSSFFKTLLCASVKEGLANEAYLKDLSSHGLRIVLDFFYNGGFPTCLSRDPSVLVEVWAFACTHNIQDLAVSCREFALMVVTAENFDSLFNSAILVDDAHTAKLLAGAVDGGLYKVIDWIMVSQLPSK
jgi:BTB/POZ domain